MFTKSSRETRECVAQKKVLIKGVVEYGIYLFQIELCFAHHVFRTKCAWMRTQNMYVVHMYYYIQYIKLHNLLLHDSRPMLLLLSSTHFWHKQECRIVYIQLVLHHIWWKLDIRLQSCIMLYIYTTIFRVGLLYAKFRKIYL